MRVTIVCDNPSLGQRLANYARTIGYQVDLINLDNCQESIDLSSSDAVLNVASDATPRNVSSLMQSIEAHGVRRLVTTASGFIKKAEDQVPRSLFERVLYRIKRTNEQLPKSNCDWTVIPESDERIPMKRIKSIISEITNDRNIRTVMSDI